MFNLYLDDLRPGPHNGICDSEIGWERWVVVRSVENAKTLLQTGLVQDLSLDHDLGMNSEDGNENPNGKQLVMWMIDNNVWPQGIITIHSANIGRAMEMKELVDRFRPSNKAGAFYPDPVP
jgi:hypothetical protein